VFEMGWVKTRRKCEKKEIDEEGDEEG